MKKNTAARGKRHTGKTSYRKNSRSRKNTVISTKVIAIITGVLVVGLVATILYTQVFKDSVDRLFAKKYSVTDVDGSKKSYTAEELEQELQSDRFYQGIRVDGVDVSGKTLEEAKAMFSDIRDQQLEELVDIQFQVGNETVKLNAGGVHLTSNIDDVLTEAFYYGKTSTLEGGDGLVERYEKVTDLKKQPKDFNSVFTIGDDNISSLTHAALDKYESAPVEAKATGFDVENLVFIITESQNGRSVDIDKAIEDVKAAFAEKNYKAVIPVMVTDVEPKTTAAALRAKLGKVSTNSSKTKDDANRNTNINLVCKKLNGLVLQPGEQFNFNQYVGERTEEKGYKEAAGIFQGASRLELGGGICQANTMLYHSVLEAGLQVDERVPHSWPSDYVDPGTDATVTWGGANFRFTNNTDYPVAIHAIYGDCWVTVEIFGRLLPDGQKIKFFAADELLLDEEPTKEQFVADPTLPVGTKEKDRKPHNHKVAKAFIVTYDADGNELDRKEVITEYPKIEALTRVGTLAPDGTIFIMDTNTGEVTPPAGYVEPTQPDQTETGLPPETTAEPPEGTTAEPPAGAPPETAAETTPEPPAETSAA